METCNVESVNHALVEKNLIVDREKFGDLKLVHFGEDTVKLHICQKLML